MANDLAETLKRLIKEKGINAFTLSKAANVSQPTLHKILSGKTTNPTLITLERIALALGADIKELTDRNKNIETVNIGSLNIVASPQLVPLISWSQAGALAGSDFNLSEEHEKYMCPEKIGKNGFCLKVQGVAMQPLFAEGDIVFINRDLIPADGDIVIAFDPAFDANNAIMRKLVCDGEHKYLQRLNSDLPSPKFIECTAKTVFVGVVVGKYVKI